MNKKNSGKPPFNTIIEVPKWDKAPPIVEVTWIDACQSSTTLYPGRLECGITNRSVGYLVFQNDNWTVVAMEWSDDNRKFRDYSQIPTGWIKRTRRLR